MYTSGLGFFFLAKLLYFRVATFEPKYGKKDIMGCSLVIL